VLLLLLALVAGCVSMEQLPASSGDPAQPYFLLVPGIEGPIAPDVELLLGLHDGGLQATFHLFDWTTQGHGIAALQAYRRHRIEAARLAARITALHRDYPLRPIILAGESGGAGIAVYALEALPEEVQIDSVLLLAPALSPKYNLSSALRHISGRCHAFVSSRDSLILGLGTQLFGTIDGQHTPAAGMKGFIMPPRAQADQYAKLICHPYDPRWTRYGHWGDHTGALCKPFARQILAPLLLTELDRRYARN
jgi:pimeloyl-ACP methyl ester carboxylesterase